MRYYLDASVFTKVFFAERGSGFMLDLLRTEDDIVSSRLGFIEVASAAYRLLREGRVTQAEVGATLQALQDPETKLVHPVEITSAVACSAMLGLSDHSLRASDAVHLATALQAGADVFVCADRRLLAAAQAEGLAGVDPTAPRE
jgi:uncharacterized protein